MGLTITRTIFVVFISLVCLKPNAQGQAGFHFGAKLGPSLANQSWNENERRMLLTYHGNVFLETRDPDNRGALFAQLGIHNRGSSFRTINFGRSNIESGYKFQNVSLMLGAKKRIETSMAARPYYLVGIRAEYTIDDNLEEVITSICTSSFLSEVNNLCPFPDPIFINRINYGISIGGGFEFTGGEFFTPSLEFTISPDISMQYDRPDLPNFNVSAAQVRNLTFEVSLVLKFLREVVYTD